MRSDMVKWMVSIADHAVHQNSPFELVGWFSTAASALPRSRHVSLHQQIALRCNASAVLLIAHPPPPAGGKHARSMAAASGAGLPLTIYEHIEGNASSGKDVVVAVSTAQQAVGGPQAFRFREVLYTTKTGDAEMIALDTTTREAAVAYPVAPKLEQQLAQLSAWFPGRIDAEFFSKGEGKERATDDAALPATSTDAAGEGSQLSAEDDALIALLTSKADAVRMLQSRIQLVKAYVAALPPSYLTQDPHADDAAHDHEMATDPSTATAVDVATTTTTSEAPTTNHAILRSIQAVLNRLPVLIPTAPEVFAEEVLARENNVQLVSLLGKLGDNLIEAKQVGKKFLTVEMRSTVCSHHYTFKPLGDCANPARDGSCHQVFDYMQLHTRCRECLAAEANSIHQELKHYLAIHRAHEISRWKHMMQQGPDATVPKDEGEHDHDKACQAARFMTERLLDNALVFDAGRARFRTTINRAIDSYRYQGITGPFSYPDHEETDDADDIPPLAPRKMYRDVLQYLDLWRNLLLYWSPVEPIAPPDILPW
ncbi:MAG: hypothetical protein M1826_001637 [Phylliscum demangeonii]|nr:MAG: hypothetical protein M1826_001637 [Phylliscum demangeonii]